MHCLWGTLDMVAALVPDTLWGLIEPFAPMPLPKPQGGRPRLADPIGFIRGHYFRAPNRYSLADAAEKTGVRLRYDLLATIAGLAAEWNLGFDPLRIAGLPLA
jgi:hypothetical protein